MPEEIPQSGGAKQEPTVQASHEAAAPTSTEGRTPGAASGIAKGFLAVIWEQFWDWCGLQAVGSQMKDHATAHAAGIKIGRVLAVLSILMLAAGVCGFLISGCRRNDVAENYRNKAEGYSDDNNRLIRENSDLKRERDKFDLKLTIAEKQANLPIQSNSPPDKRLDLVLEKVESLVNALPPAPTFAISINDRVLQNTNEPVVIELDESRIIAIGVRNLGEITIENISVQFAGSSLALTNVIASDWRALGQLLALENQNLKHTGTPCWTTTSEKSVGGGQLWSTWPITISTNFQQPFLISSIAAYSDRSKFHRINAVFVFKPWKVQP